MLWTVGRPDGMTHRPNEWQGTEFSNLQTVQNLLEALLNSGIPVKQHHYNEVIFVQQNVANYKPINSPFGHSGTKITWLVKNTMPVQIKNYSPFLSQRDKG